MSRPDITKRKELAKPVLFGVVVDPDIRQPEFAMASDGKTKFVTLRLPYSTIKSIAHNCPVQTKGPFLGGVVYIRQGPAFSHRICLDTPGAAAGELWVTISNYDPLHGIRT